MCQPSIFSLSGNTTAVWYTDFIRTACKGGAGEQWLKEQGFPIVRLRVHGDILRIEIDKERFSDFIAMADKITAKMKELGFVYITLDAEGFRSGSMDVHIVK